MISNFLEILILSIVQGISEFIPVSSSAHLIIFSNIVNFSNKSLIFDVGLHLGSLLAIVYYFKKELLNISNDKKLFHLLLIGSIPLILVGYIFYSTGIIDSFRNLKVIAWTTLIFGILMYFADTFKIKKYLIVRYEKIKDNIIEIIRKKLNSKFSFTASFKERKLAPIRAGIDK